jgi:hypothetical protein
MGQGARGAHENRWLVSIHSDPNASDSRAHAFTGNVAWTSFKVEAPAFEIHGMASDSFSRLRGSIRPQRKANNYHLRSLKAAHASPFVDLTCGARIPPLSSDHCEPSRRSLGLSLISSYSSSCVIGPYIHAPLLDAFHCSGCTHLKTTLCPVLPACARSNYLTAFIFSATRKCHIPRWLSHSLDTWLISSAISHPLWHGYPKEPLLLS